MVFLAGGAVDSAIDMRRLAWDLEHEDVAVVIAPSVTDVSSERVSVRPVGGMPLIHLEKPRSAEAVRRAKRTFDVFGSLGLLLLFSPVFAFGAFKVWRISTAVRCSSARRASAATARRSTAGSSAPW